MLTDAPAIPTSEILWKPNTVLSGNSTGGTSQLSNIDDPRNRALVNIPKTSRFTDGSSPR